MNTLTTIQKRLRFWSVCNLVLQQALGQLDPHRAGLSLTVAQCMHPDPQGKIRSVRERIGVGTAPWSRDVEAKALFLGAESLAGYVVTTGHPTVLQNLEDSVSPLVKRVEYEESAAAYPLLHEGRIAGCLLVSSAQRHHFTPARCALISDYADLVALAFSPEDFYEWSLLELRVMPGDAVQKSHLASFRERLASLLLEAAQSRTPLTNEQAEQLVWQQLEEAFLALPPQLQPV